MSTNKVIFIQTETLKEVEEAKKELFSKGLVIENVVQDTELEEIYTSLKYR